MTASQAVPHAQPSQQRLVRMAARIELQLRGAGLASNDGILTHEAAQQRATSAGRIFERMWEYLAAGDIESSGTFTNENAQ